MTTNRDINEAELRPTTDRYGNDLGDSLAYFIQHERSPGKKFETTGYSDSRSVSEILEASSSKCTVTYTEPQNGSTVTYDLGNVQWAPAPNYEPYEEWEAHLCTRDGEVLAVAEEKAPWYARLFARLLWLEWRWEKAYHTNVSWTGAVVNTPCIAAEDIPLGSVVLNNQGFASAARP